MLVKEANSKPQLTDKDLFVLYSPPNDANHYLVLQKDQKLDIKPNYNKDKGFFVRSFESEEDSFFIRQDELYINSSIDFRPLQKFERKCMKKDEYLKLAEYFTSQCERGNFDKIVLSRIKKVYRDNANVMPLFLSLKQKYPYAFIYLMNIPGVSCWIGASPEILLKKEGSNYHTVALAGTMKDPKSNIENIKWGQKESYEQKLVEEYFANKIEKFDSQYIKLGPNTKKAGLALHLCSEFNFIANTPPEKILESFHPSPAVCGLPEKDSFEFIISSEPHKRRYYSGYLGPLNHKNTTLMYVNLRCMEVSADAFYMYVGGGITADSDPINEWEETELKSLTLQSIIEKMYLYADVIR